MTNLDKIKAHLTEHGHATTREMAARYGWKSAMANSLASRAHVYRHIEIAGKQPSPVSAQHWEIIWRIRQPAVVRT